MSVFSFAEAPQRDVRMDHVLCREVNRQIVNFECHQDDGGCGYSIEIELSPCEDPSSSSDYIESTADRTGNCMICSEELEKEIIDIANGRMSIYTCPECNGNDETGKDSHWAHFKIRIFEPIDWYATD